MSYLHSRFVIEFHLPGEILYLVYAGFHVYAAPEGFT
jgi:hypothetical protein